ncbi:MAG: BMP family ABC transporter substrate-binding protein, partial [Bacillota bacterium]|nr:BMP family ABC transporter substrate-binding protein [Bacillota bacterium]
MKKVLGVVLSALLAAGMLAGCASKSASTTTSDSGSNSSSGSSSKGFEIALITDKGNIDDKSFNQGAWEGVEKFAKANNIKDKYYKPEEASDAGYLAAIDLAVTGGAKVVVTPGYLFEVPVYDAQTKYPDVKFILLDGAPHTADYKTYETKTNVA